MDLSAIIISVKDIAELCNGSTADSDSVCEGSNPSSAATKAHIVELKSHVVLFLFFSSNVLELYHYRSYHAGCFLLE